ncbi:MAG: GHKL domain-containing protein [Candidatus Nanopelagicaceae bacterium]|jgi:two-component system sensor histidine kinase SenX3|nr:GHKL domain-containing protein [Candidatus Nanopelagicaceae bacterium]
MYRHASQAQGEINLSGRNVDQKLIDLLELTDTDYLIVDSDDSVITCCETVVNIGLVNGNRVTSEAIRKLIRNARKKDELIETEVAIPRGSLTNGFHERRVRISSIGQDGTVAVLIFDDTEARRLDAVRRDFVANISHELKTPIGGISILAEALAEANNDPELVKNFSERMQIEATRLSHLVQEIIDLSRIQDQNTMQNSEMVSLNKIIEEAIDQSKVLAGKRHVELNFASEEEVQFFGDRKQLVMAISNLIENAINYSPERTSVNVLLRKNNEVAEISISDQGVGIAEADIERIFERFYRVDSARSRDTGGTGLGLSIVKHVISNHGGDIQVWSDPGTGSTFTVLLPLTNTQKI